MTLSFLAKWPAWLLAVVCGVLGVAIGYAASWTVPASGLDRVLYDTAVCLAPETRHAPADSVVMVEIDRVTLDEYFSPNPYPISAHLDVHTRFVERLSAAGARTIAFDILFDRVDSLPGLEDFARACSLAGNVVLAAGLDGTNSESQRTQPPWREISLLLPVERLRQVCDYALTNMPSDADGVIRRCRKGTRFLDTVYASMPCYLSRSAPAAAEPETSTPLINFPRSQSAIIRLPAHAVLEGEHDERLAGRIVIIGVEDPEGSDHYRTPYSLLTELTGLPTQSGLAILASATQTVVDGSTPREISRHVSALAFLPLAIAWSALLLRRRIWINAILYIVLAATITAGAIGSVADLNAVVPAGLLLFGLLATHVCAALMVYVLVRQGATAMRTELEEGRETQNRLLPEELPSVSGLRVAARLAPSLQLTGDYYDAFKLDDQRLALFIADVSGKGAPASLVMSSLHATLHGEREDLGDPPRVLDHLNRALCEWVKPGTFATALYAVIDRSVPECRYACAGHNPPYLIRVGKEPQSLAEGDLVLGAVAGHDYKEYNIPLASGDTLFFYTDGLSEATNHKGKEFGHTVMLGHFEEFAGDDPQRSLERLYAALERYHGRAHFDDDTTVMIVRVQ